MLVKDWSTRQLVNVKVGQLSHWFTGQLVNLNISQLVIFSSLIRHSIVGTVEGRGTFGHNLSSDRALGPAETERLVARSRWADIPPLAWRLGSRSFRTVVTPPAIRGLR